MVRLSIVIKFNALSLLLIPLLLLPVLVLAQEAQLELEFVGYGKNYQEIHISFKNIGEITISDITVYMDGEVYKTIEGASAPKTAFINVFFLEEGKHTIEARTPEGAYDSIEVRAYKSEVSRTTTTTTIPEEVKLDISDLIEENITLIVLVAAIVVFVVSTWLILKEKSEEKK